MHSTHGRIGDRKIEVVELVGLLCGDKLLTCMNDTGPDACVFFRTDYTDYQFRSRHPERDTVRLRCPLPDIRRCKYAVTGQRTVEQIIPREIEK